MAKKAKRKAGRGGKTIAEHAADILRETDNPAVMYGDCGLLDMIFIRAGLKDRNPKGMNWCPPHVAHKRVLNALEGSSLFMKSVVNMRPGYRGNPYCRVFTLKAEASQ